MTGGINYHAIHHRRSSLSRRTFPAIRLRDHFSRLLRKATQRTSAVSKEQTVREFSSITGYGAQAQLVEEMLYVGKPGLFERFDLDSKEITAVDELRAEGKTVGLVGTEGGSRV
ncbi:hypothetical protein [Halalkalicoccus tibetensis]|uniref:Uncharacterized protein n=1 Tax=Halalkalicoccus tibetensis TaxID=175632 RepID=A0ABD5VCQ5_9EURY